MLFNCGIGEDLRVPWTAKRSNQSILKEISPEYSLEGLMLKLKFQYFGQLMQRADSLEKILILGKIEGRRRRGPERTRFLEDKSASLTPWTWVWASSRRWWRTGKPVCYSPWRHKESDMTYWLNTQTKLQFSVLSSIFWSLGIYSFASLITVG